MMVTMICSKNVLSVHTRRRETGRERTVTITDMIVMMTLAMAEIMALMPLPMAETMDPCVLKSAMATQTRSSSVHTMMVEWYGKMWRVCV